MSDLPNTVLVPEWERDLPDVTIDTPYGQLRMRAMGDDDVYIDGTLTYRGHEYTLPYAHTTADGTLKGYGNNGRDYGPVTSPWQVAQAFRPSLPDTYRAPLAEVVRVAVRRYLDEHADHAAENRRIQAVQNVNRYGSEYNAKAEELRALLDRYDAAVQAAGLGAQVWEANQ